MSPSGYSGTPLSKKLGLKSGFRVKVKNPPNDYIGLLSPLPEGVVISPRLHAPVDIWHLFTDARSELQENLPKCQREIRQDGMIWVSWPKKSSGISSDLTEDVIRGLALPLGLVDIKVAAVDFTWSGLKLVIRKELRTPD